MNRESEKSPFLGRLLAWIVIALIAASTVYTAWIVIINFDRIGV